MTAVAAQLRSSEPPWWFAGFDPQGTADQLDVRAAVLAARAL